MCAFAAATLGALTLISSSAAATRPIAAAPPLEGAKNGTAVVLDAKTGAVLYVRRGLPAPKSSAAATRPIAAAPPLEGAKNGTAIVLDAKTGAVLYVWRGLPAPKNGTALVLDAKTGAVLYVGRGHPGRWSPWPGVKRP